MRQPTHRPAYRFSLHATVALALVVGAGPAVAQGGATGAATGTGATPVARERYLGTFVGNNFAGPVTVDVVRDGDGFRVTDRSSPFAMTGTAQVGEGGVLAGEFVVRVLGITRRHRFSLTPDGNGFRYRTTGQDTPLTREAPAERGSASADGASANRAPANDDSRSNPWFETIGGRELVVFESYSSGGSGYMSERRTRLCTNGSFSYRSSSSSSISVDGASAGGASSGRDDGRWRLRTEGAATILELRWTDGRVSRYELTRRGTDIYLNDQRHLRGDRVC